MKGMVSVSFRSYLFSNVKDENVNQFFDTSKFPSPFGVICSLIIIIDEYSEWTLYSFRLLSELSVL